MAQDRTTTVTGRQHGLPEPLTFVVEQLWAPALAHEGVRAVVGSQLAPTGPWVTHERYQVLPTLAAATMLLPDDTRAATVGALRNFRGLRRRVPNLQRTLLGALAARGVSPFPRVELQVDGRRPAPPLPLATVAAALGLPEVQASIGINRSANRKTTLQLVSRDGAPEGFAKFSWEPVSVAAVRAEAAALRAVGGRPGPARAPRLLAAEDFYGSPFIVTAPLPAESVGVRSSVRAPSAGELYSLLPLHRRAAVADTGQFRALRGRLAEVTEDSSNREVLGAAAALLAVLADSDVEVPVGVRWHGDLAAWNVARSGDGTLWCWDWESSEEDAAAGLDALHWHMSAGTEAGRAWDGAALIAATAAAGELTTAAGASHDARATLAALYSATIAERACTLAAGAGGWEAEWLTPRQLLDMLATARARLTPRRSRTA